MEKIGIFGGSFNPPHMGHVNGAIACIKELKLNKLYFVPSNIPPHKAVPQLTATAAQRYDMTRLAAKYVEKSMVSPFELRAGGKSYTVDTVAYFRRIKPRAQLYFIMGSDMLKSFLEWYKPEEIAAMCTIAALCRDQSEKQEMTGYVSRAKEKIGGQYLLIENEIITVSSTDIRSGINHHLVPEDIMNYIKENNLYL